jgi:hypothetical protein
VLSYCHTAATLLSYCHTVVLSYCHTAVSYCHTAVILPYCCHTAVILPHCCHTATLLSRRCLPLPSQYTFHAHCSICALKKSETGVLKKEAADSLESSVPSATQRGVTSLKTATALSPYFLYVFCCLLCSELIGLCVLIIRFMYVFLSCMFWCVFCLRCVFVLSCVLFLYCFVCCFSPSIDIAVYFLFVNNFADRCHQVETQLQLINIISYHRMSDLSQHADTCCDLHRVHTVHTVNTIHTVYCQFGTLAVA